MTEKGNKLWVCCGLRKRRWPWAAKDLARPLGPVVLLAFLYYKGPYAKLMPYVLVSRHRYKVAIDWAKLTYFSYSMASGDEMINQKHLWHSSARSQFMNKQRRSNSCLTAWQIGSNVNRVSLLSNDKLIQISVPGDWHWMTRWFKCPSHVHYHMGISILHSRFSD